MCLAALLVVLGPFIRATFGTAEGECRSCYRWRFTDIQLEGGIGESALTSVRCFTL